MSTKKMKSGVKAQKPWLIILGGGLFIILLGGFFFIGKKFGENKESQPQTKTNQKIELEGLLKQLESQFQREPNQTKKQELQQKINKTKQQIQNLGGSNNPSPPNPPPKTSQQLTVKCNGAVGGKCEYINIANPKERILVDTKNKVYYSNNALYIKGQQYTISFYEEDTDKKGNNFVFDENNDKFQLTPATNPPHQPNPQPQPQPLPNNNPNQIQVEVRWSGTLKPGYVMFVNKGQGIADDGKQKCLFYIQESHPIFKGKKIDYEPFESPFTTPHPIPKFRLSFKEKDVSQKLNDDGWLFDENNKLFSLTPLGNWPDDPNYDEGENPKINKNESKVLFVAQNFGGESVFTNNITGIIEVNGVSRSEMLFHVSNKNPHIKKLVSQGKLQKNKQFTIHYREVDKLDDRGGGNYVFTFNEFNKNLEITEV